VRYSQTERLLVMYFNALSMTASFRHAMKMNEKATILKLTGILQCFASLIGEGVKLAAVAVPV
jgi:hypothetical protein